jgi:hypothetical protein
LKRSAVDLVLTIAEWADEALHRQILLRLVDDADDERIWHVAAGPLEDFLTDNDHRLRWMEHQCVHHPGFQKALQGVWTHGKSPETAARIEAASPETL